MKTVSLESLGCRLNISETGTLAKSFVDNGYKIIPFGKSADVTLINTCTVTARAEAACRNLIRKARRISPDGKIIIIGCYAQISSDEIVKNMDVDLILGSFEKGRVFKFLQQSEMADIKEIIVETSKNDFFFQAATTIDDFHTRAFLKIQDGCDYVCSYCIIPYARGQSRSLAGYDVLKTAKKLINNGFKEIVLTGVNISDYRGDGKENLLNLVKQMIGLQSLERLRLSSLEPNIIDESFLKILKSSSKIMDHFHLSLQSGDDRILKLMRRRYLVSDFKQAVELVKKYFPNAGIGIDVIVGFPGENEESFGNTLKLLQKLPLTHFHIFPYSKRKGTSSFKLESTVDSKTVKKWVKMLIDLGNLKLNDFHQGFIDKEMDVLFEKRVGKDFEGFSSNYLKVKVKARDNQDLKNQIGRVLITSFENGCLRGQLN